MFKFFFEAGLAKVVDLSFDFLSESIPIMGVTNGIYDSTTILTSFFGENMNEACDPGLSSRDGIGGFFESLNG